MERLIDVLGDLHLLTRESGFIDHRDGMYHDAIFLATEWLRRHYLILPKTKRNLSFVRSLVRALGEDSVLKPYGRELDPNPEFSPRASLHDIVRWGLDHADDPVNEIIGVLTHNYAVIRRDKRFDDYLESLKLMERLNTGIERVFEPPFKTIKYSYQHYLYDESNPTVVMILNALRGVDERIERIFPTIFMDESPIYYVRDVRLMIEYWITSDDRTMAMIANKDTEGLLDLQNELQVTFRDEPFRKSFPFRFQPSEFFVSASVHYLVNGELFRRLAGDDNAYGLRLMVTRDNDQTDYVWVRPFDVESNKWNGQGVITVGVEVKFDFADLYHFVMNRLSESALEKINSRAV